MNHRSFDIVVATFALGSSLCWGALRVEQSFDRDWRFHQGDTPAATAPGFDDTQWRALDVPHDWGIEGPFGAALPNRTGKLPWAGIGWYRKAFSLPETDKAMRIFLDFDGAMSLPKVFVNGKLAGGWAYGYNSFRVEITDFVNLPGSNLVAVRLENPADSSRWYPGGGLYRHVRLVKTSPIHIAHWGVFVHTPRVSTDEAEVVMETTVDNQSAQPEEMTVRQDILAPESRQVLASGEAKLPGVTAHGSGKTTTRLAVKKPQLWDIDSPRLHTLRTTILSGGHEVDRVEMPFGIRQIEWNAEKGFLLNNRVVKLQGVCNHHDLGALGAAFNLRAAGRQLEILRGMGCNAIRTSHNPPAPQLLDLCDRMGFLVMNELFDCWKLGKTPGDYADNFDAWHERDVVNFVRRDRNHPSVILWSTGNEIREQAKQPEGHDLSRKLTALFKREDPTRPVSNGMNNGAAIANGFARTLNVAGYNYKAILAKTPNYLDHLKANPGQPFFGAETASAVSSRGVYFFPVSGNKGGGFFRFQVSSYDLYAPPWANIPDHDFDSADQLPALAGEFVWTGFDYLGEPTPYNNDESNLLNFTDEAERQAMMAEMKKLGGNVPSRSSYFGIVDLAGFPKDRYYLYQSRWRPDLPMAHLLPHWNWSGREGEITPVHLYTSGDEAELFLNGRSMGRKKKGEREYRLRWNDVKYEPGELKGIAYKNGKPWAEAIRRTTGKTTSLKLEADRSAIRADGDDLSFVTVSLRDASGELVPTASPLLRFQVEGAGEFVAADNGDATDLRTFSEPQRNAFNGLALVIVRARRSASGPIQLTVESEGLPAARLTLSATPGSHSD